MKKSTLVITIIIIVAIIAGVWIYAEKRSIHMLQDQEQAMARSTMLISDTQIRTYLEHSNFAEPHFGGASFLAFERLAEVASSTEVVEYVWLSTQEYYKKAGTLEKGYGVSLPVAIYFNHTDPVAINAPREGSFYDQDLKKIFPEDILATSTITDSAIHDEHVTLLEADIKNQAEKYFGMSLENTAATSTVLY